MEAASPAEEFEFGSHDCFGTFLNIMKTNLLFIFLFACFVAGQLDALAQRRGSKVPWPLLYPNPEHPGKSPFSDMRNKMLACFDKDGDGTVDSGLLQFLYFNAFFFSESASFIVCLL